MTSGLARGRTAADLEPVERDSRGILHPRLLRDHVRLVRYPPPPSLSGLVDRFWAVRWDLPAAVAHRQQVLTHPGANLSVGTPNAEPPGAGRPDGIETDGIETDGIETDGIEARLYGVARAVTTRVLVGRGWTVAAMTTPGGVGAFLDGSATRHTDRVVPLGAAVGGDEVSLVARILAAETETDRVAVLADYLERAVRPARVAGARRVAAAARVAERDRGVRRLDQWCAQVGVRPRTLQRLFLDHAGVSPTWVLRRYRLLDAAEAVRDGAAVSWADVAADLGYADQAHLSRDFRAATGYTPVGYARAQRPH